MPAVRRLLSGVLFAAVILGTNAFGQGTSVEPAPVPKEVAIPRPTAAEIQTAERALETFFRNANPEVKEINRKFPGLIAVRVPSSNTAIVPNLNQRFQQQFQSNLEVARKGDIDVLFVGDSITDFWRSDREPYAGKPVFDKYFGEWKVANFGIAGDTTQGVL